MKMIIYIFLDTTVFSYIIKFLLYKTINDVIFQGNPIP